MAENSHPRHPLPDREILLDWHHQCRACRYWDGDRQARGNAWGRCTETAITGMTDTTQCGNCRYWEPWLPVLWKKIVEDCEKDGRNE